MTEINPVTPLDSPPDQTARDVPTLGVPRVIKRIGFGLFIAVLLYVLLGFWALPHAARFFLNGFLQDHVREPASIARIELNPFTGELGVYDFKVGEPGKEKMAFSRLWIDLQIDSVWTRAVHLSVIELDNATVAAQMSKGGELDLLTLLQLPPAEKDKPPAKRDDGLFPLRIDRVQISDAKLHWQDLRQPGKVELQVTPLTVTLEGVSTVNGEPGRLQLRADAGKAGRLEIDAGFTIPEQRTKGRVVLHDSQLSGFWSYAQAYLPLTLKKAQLDLDVEFMAEMGKPLRVTLDNGKIALRSLLLNDPQNNPLLSFNQLKVEPIRVELHKQQVQIGNVLLEGVETPLVREADGRLNWQRIFAAPPKNGAKTASSTPPRAESKPWSIAIPAIQLRDANVGVLDQTINPPQALDLSIVQLGVKGFDSSNKTPLSLSLDARIGAKGQSNGTEGQLQAEGQLDLAKMSAQMQVTNKQLDLRLAQPYLQPFVRLELRSGLLDSQLQVDMASADPLTLKVGGDVFVHQLHTQDTLKNQDLLKWQQLHLSGLQYAHGERLDIQTVKLQAPYVRFVINENLSTNISELLISKAGAATDSGNLPDTTTTAAASVTDPSAKVASVNEASAKEPTATVSAATVPSATVSAANVAPNTVSTPAETTKKALAIRIGGIEISNGSANFADYSLNPNFATAIAQLNGTVGTLDNQQVLPTALDIQGKVDRYAPVSIAGSLTPFNPMQQLDINAKFKRVELTTLTPYSGKFAGYRIRKGRLNLDLHYTINQGRLSANNKVVLEELQLGEKVDSPDAVDLPIRLAVALLKDSRGNIKVELPIEGDLNNPKFSVGPVIWKTLRNLIVRAVKSPFSFISGLINGDSSENLDAIAFSPGSSELSADAAGKLKTVAEALKDRPQLRLEVEGASAQHTDGEPMAQQLLAAEFRKVYLKQLQQRGEKMPADADSIVVPDNEKPALLAKLYVDQFDQPIPEAWAKQPEPTRNAQLQEAIIDRLGESERRLRQLARERAAAIKGWLVEEGGLADKRIYLLNAQLREDKPGESVNSMLYLDSQ